MSELLESFVGGRWVAGTGAGTPLVDPITGAEVARVSSEGLDVEGGFTFARSAGKALRARSYAERAAMLGEIAKLLSSKKDDYYAIATANSGTTKPDSAIDIEGSSYTLSYYAKLGAGLGALLRDGDVASLAKDGSFASQHVLLPTHGLALLINAYNFPGWGLWEKAAPALLSGVPVVVKPATPTAWLTQRMVKDVVSAGILPEGALSIVCGSPAGLLDHVAGFDVVSFTGSAATAAKLRGHAAFVERSARINVEADSINSAVLASSAGQATVDAFVAEVVREMTQKSGQKCTAIRRAFVPRAKYDEIAEALRAKLAKVTVGNPRNESVRMGALVNRAQLDAVKAGIAALERETARVFGGDAALVDADAAVAACIGPHLFGDADGTSRAVHDLEVFGPVATLIGYDDVVPEVERGHGSLVVSVFGDDDAELAKLALALAPTHGRVHVVSSAVAKGHTGHGNVMPQSVHGGPGRAGGGEELGGLRALGFYHRRAAIQAPATTLAGLP